MWFAVIMLIVVEMETTTPPYGGNLFVMMGVKAIGFSSFSFSNIMSVPFCQMVGLNDTSGLTLSQRAGVRHSRLVVLPNRTSEGSG